MMGCILSLFRGVMYGIVVLVVLIGGIVGVIHALGSAHAQVLTQKIYPVDGNRIADQIYADQLYLHIDDGTATEAEMYTYPDHGTREDRCVDSNAYLRTLKAYLDAQPNNDTQVYDEAYESIRSAECK